MGEKKTLSRFQKMNKSGKKIIITLLMVAIFMAPISVGVDINPKGDLIVKIEKREARAEDLTDCLFNATTFTASATSDAVVLDYRIKLSEDYRSPSQITECYSYIKGYETPYSNSLGTEGRKKGLFLFYYETGKNNLINFSFEDLGLNFSTRDPENPKSDAPAYKAPPDRFNFKPDTEYTAGIAVVESCWGTPYLDGAGVIKNGYSPSALCIAEADTTNNSIIKTATFRTPKEFLNKGTSYEEYTKSQEAGGYKELGLGCTDLTNFSISGCIAQVAYGIWSLSSPILTLSAEVLDFFIFYATNSSSYKNAFVEQGWASMRDIANIFFIIALLYIAIKTILGLNVSNNQKLISAVILIALIINFSLFTTKLVIDSSNILAKVFYNNIVSENQKGQLTKDNINGQKTISIGIVDKFNPQTLLGDTQKFYGKNPYTFILLIIVLSAISLYTAYIFLSVAILFAARVVSLWISMILSPIAFASHAVPFDIPGMGHKEWWSNLFKNVLLAPIFIFFLYIIILFVGFLKDIVHYSGTSDVMGSIMNTLIPFLLVIMLLKQAQSLAIEYSGEMGKAIMKGGAVVGGLALGAAASTTAFAGRTLIGGGVGGAANTVAGWAEKGVTSKNGLIRGVSHLGNALRLRDVSDLARKSSFDVRGVKVAGQSLASTTGMKVGDAHKGGWGDMKKKQEEKRQKRADELEKRGTGKEKNAVTDAEIKLKEATLPVKLKLEDADREIDKARKDLQDAAPSEKDFYADILRERKKAKEKIRDGANDGLGLKVLETAVHEAKQKLDIKSDEITTAYAKTISGSLSKTVNFLTHAGAYSLAGANAAARKIKSGTKLDSGEKPH
ncbi:MAG: hypothetical protein WCS86_03100 [Candidatus Paceibacterota bacterium]